MAWNGSGIFNRLYSWVSDAANNVNILASRMDDEFANYKGGLENCLTRTGETTPTADLPMAGHKFTNVADATALTDFSSLGQVYSLAPVENLIPNSYFEVNQRAQTTYSANGYTVDNLYLGLNGGTIATLAIVPSVSGGVTHDGRENIKTFAVVNVVAGTGASDYGLLFMDIPDLQKLSGQKVTVIFYAYSSINGNKLSVEASQWFDQPNGGSTPVTGIGVTKYTLNTTGSRFVWTFTVPSIFGKTIGQRSALRIYFWLDGGSSWDSRNGALGHQSGFTTLYNVRAHIGDSERRVYRRMFEEELELCKSWYQKNYAYNVVPGTPYFASQVCPYFGGLGQPNGIVALQKKMAATPTVVIYQSTGAINSAIAYSIVAATATSFPLTATGDDSNFGVPVSGVPPTVGGSTTLVYTFNWTAEVPALT